MCEQDREVPSVSEVVAVSQGWPLWGCLKSLPRGWRRQPCSDGGAGGGGELASVRCFLK